MQTHPHHVNLRLANLICQTQNSWLDLHHANSSKGKLSCTHASSKLKPRQTKTTHHAKTWKDKQRCIHASSSQLDKPHHTTLKEHAHSRLTRQAQAKHNTTLLTARHNTMPRDKETCMLTAHIHSTCKQTHAKTLKGREKRCSHEKDPTLESFKLLVPMHNIKERKINFMLLAPMQAQANSLTMDAQERERKSKDTREDPSHAHSRLKLGHFHLHILTL